MYATLVLFSEVILSAYPILIKKVDASTFLQTGIRMATFAGLAALAAFTSQIPLLSGLSLKEVLATGLLNLLHVGASYTAFEALPAGNAMALFYTYPVWNLLGTAWMFKEKIPEQSMPWIGLALFGAVLLSQPSSSGWNIIGIIAALVAALTETGIYLWFRKNTPAEESQPWTKMFEMYGGSALLWILVALIITSFGASKIFHASSGGIKAMLLFNALIGFVGYALRFYTIPKVSTITFSAISFFGVIASYLMGWIFIGEVPDLIQLAGAVAIIVANTILVRKDTV